LPLTVLVEVKIGAPLQLALFGPKRVKVIAPVGAAPPERVALSEIFPPTLTPAEACVLIVGLALLTAIVLLVPVMELLLVSVAVTVWMPTVRSVALKVPVALVSVLLAGNVALGSVLVNCTVPV